MKQVQLVSILAIVCTCLFSGYSVAAEKVPLRVALLDVGGKSQVPPELIDLLTVELSQSPDFELLERQEIDHALREQELNLQSVQSNRGDIVAAGKILGAQALVMLWAEPSVREVDRSSTVHVRIVETTRGVRFGETVLAWQKEPQSVDTQFNAVAELLTTRLRRVQDAQAGVTVVSIAGFQTDELSQQAQRVRRDLENWLEVWLAGQPGIAVAERTQVLPLIAERKLAADLNESLGDADATVAGSFQIDFSKKQPVVTITLRVLRKGHTTTNRSLQAPISQLTELRDQAGQAILELLNIDSSATRFDAKTESHLLTDQARRLLSLRRKYEALDQLIAAHALDPESMEIQTLLLQAGRGLGVGPDFTGSKFEASFFPTALLLADVARQVLGRFEQGHTPHDKTNTYHSRELLGHVIEHCKLMGQVQFLIRGREPSEQEIVQQEWLRASTDDLFNRFFSVAKARGGPVLEYAVYCGLQAGIYWAKSPAAALEQRRELFEQAAQLTHQRSFGLWTFTTDHRFRLTSNKSWAELDDLGPASEKYFRQLQASEHAVVRAVGQREAANYSLWVLDDRARAMRHYDQFIDLITEEVIPEHPRLADASHGLWLHLNEKRGYLELTSEEAGKHWSRVILARWSTKRLPPRNSQNWEHLIKGTMLHLEEAEEVQAANHLLRTCIESLEKAPVGLDRSKIPTQWRETLGRLQQLKQGLEERHPELRSGDRNARPTLAIQCQLYLTIEQAMSKLPSDERIPKHHWFFSGLVPTSQGFVVSYAIKQGGVRTPGATRFTDVEWVAIARLDKAGKFQSATIYPEPFTYDYRRSLLTGIVGRILRPLVATDAGVFLSVPANGIVWFPPDKPPIHFSSKYLESPSPNHRPVPFEEASELVTMDGKLYIKSGSDPFLPQIYEFDYQKARSTLLLDLQTLTEKSPLFGRIGFSFTPNPPRKLFLWAWSGGVPREDDHDHEPPGGDLFLLDLKNKSIRQVESQVHLSHPWVHYDEQFHLGLKTSRGSLAIFNPHTRSLDWQLKDEEEKLPALRQVSLRMHQFTHNESFLLTSAKRPGAISERERSFHIQGGSKGEKAASDWLLYQKQKTQAQRFVADQLPSPEKVVRFFFDSNNQIMLMTAKGLYRVKLPVEDRQ